MMCLWRCVLVEVCACDVLVERCVCMHEAKGCVQACKFFHWYDTQQHTHTHTHTHTHIHTHTQNLHAEVKAWALRQGS